MAAPSSILAWRIPWTEEPGGLQSRGSQRVRQTASRLSLLPGLSESTCGIFLLNWERRALFSISFRAGSRLPPALTWRRAVVRGSLRAPAPPPGGQPFRAAF